MAYGISGMKVPEFGFDAGEDSDYLPHNTRDQSLRGVRQALMTMTPAEGWYASLDEHGRKFGQGQHRSPVHTGGRAPLIGI
ncbi:MAG: hypothetical protein ACLR0U_10085 [Enterocloster clostridioformis]